MESLPTKKNFLVCREKKYFVALAILSFSALISHMLVIFSYLEFKLCYFLFLYPLFMLVSEISSLPLLNDTVLLLPHEVIFMDYIVGFLALSFLFHLANRRHHKSGGRKVSEFGCISQVFIVIMLFVSSKISQKFTAIYHVCFLL